MASENAKPDVDASRQPIVVIRDGEVFANSRDVADSFGKRHDNVLQAIDNLLQTGGSSDLRNLFVERSEIHDQARKTVRLFDMNRDGFALLAMGFTGQKALKWKLSYLQAFNAMEAELHKQSEKALAGEQLDLLVDHRPDASAERARQHALVIKEIGGTRGALLHYIKNTVIGGYLDEKFRYITDRLIATHERDVIMIGRVSDLAAKVDTVLGMARRAADPEAFIRSEWCDVDDVYVRAGVGPTIPRRRSLSANVARSLDAFCKNTNRQLDARSWRHGGRQASYWLATTVDLWLRQSGDMLIRSHLANHHKANDMVGPNPDSLRASASTTRADDNAAYRRDMIDAGRGHLLR